jgi:hypothetical protein
VVVPYWFLAALLSVLPARWAVTRWRRGTTSRRLLAGLCAACGYDLRATLGRCPECGSPRSPQQSPRVVVA